jgi:hypothetical protein
MKFKSYTQLPTLLEIAYNQYCEINKQYEELKKLKEMKKNAILSFLKKEQTDAIKLNNKYIIKRIDKSGPVTIDKTKLKSLNESLYTQCIKHGKPSTSLTVIPIKK